MVIFAKNVNQALGSTCTYKYLQVLKNVWEEVPVLSEYLERSDRFDVSAGRFSFRARISIEAPYIPYRKIIRLAQTTQKSLEAGGPGSVVRSSFLWVGSSSASAAAVWWPKFSSPHEAHQFEQHRHAPHTSARLATAHEHKNLFHYSGSIRAFVDLVCVGWFTSSKPSLYYFPLLVRY
jgi:hypothetical protein